MDKNLHIHTIETPTGTRGILFINGISAFNNAQMKKYNYPHLDSQQIRKILELRLLDIFANQEIQKYLNINKVNVENLDSVSYGACYGKISSIKMAYHIWTHMEALDRYAVLNLYSCLFKDYSLVASSEKITLIFSSIFINELVQVFEKAIIGFVA